jgi:hypothetical protein
MRCLPRQELTNWTVVLALITSLECSVMRSTSNLQNITHGFQFLRILSDYDLLRTSHNTDIKRSMCSSHRKH